MAAKAWSLLTPVDDAKKNTIPDLIRDVKKHVAIAAGFYAEAQSTPDQTIAIYAGIVFFGITKVEYAGLDVADLGTSGTFETTALTADYYNKILFTIDSSGTVAIVEGTEHAVLGSVVAPAIPAGKFPICMVTVQDDGTATAGTILTIEQSEIQQLQGFGFIGAALAANDFLDTIQKRMNFQDCGIVTNAIGAIGGGAQTIDLLLGNSVSATVDTSETTFTFSNPTASDELCPFSLVLTNGGSQTVNWPASVDWAGSDPPELTAAGVDILIFSTIDGGTTWHGSTFSLDSS